MPSLGTAAAGAGMGMWEVLASAGGSAPFPLSPNSRSSKPSSARPFWAVTSAVWPLFVLPCGPASLLPLSICPCGYVEVNTVYLGSEGGGFFSVELIFRIEECQWEKNMKFLYFHLYDLKTSHNPLTDWHNSLTQHFTVTLNPHSIAKLDFATPKISRK